MTNSRPDDAGRVTCDRCDHVRGPFFHGTGAALQVGDHLAPGHASPFDPDRTSRHVYFSALVETAAWGAELATALAGDRHRGYIYVVRPLGPFEDDPNVTDKKFPGNITESYRTRDRVEIVGEITDWEGHAPDVLRTMLDNIERLRAEGLDVVDD